MSHHSSNWWFRVAIHHGSDGRLRFEHPTVPGNGAGGWMQRLKDEGRDILKPNFHTSPSESIGKVAKEEMVSMIKTGVVRKITTAELKIHSSAEKPWFVVNGEGQSNTPATENVFLGLDLKVYDGTGFLKDHPGGEGSITGVGGQDASEDLFVLLLQ